MAADPGLGPEIPRRGRRPLCGDDFLVFELAETLANSGSASPRCPAVLGEESKPAPAIDAHRFFPIFSGGSEILPGPACVFAGCPDLWSLETRRNPPGGLRLAMGRIGCSWVLDFGSRAAGR